MYDLTTLINNLQKNGFTVSHFKTGKEAAEYIDSKVDGKTVGFGGSTGVEQIGLYDLLKTHNSVSHHWHGGSIFDSAKADVYISSANGLTEKGEIINIDATGNRISSMLFGHESFYMVIGSNKIAEDYEKAFWRVKNVVAPKNAQRLKYDTPCAIKADKCYDCNSPQCICRVLNVMWKKPHGIKNFEIVLVDEELGF